MYTLPPLPYPYNALEPHIDARTMEIHYTKHHQAYVDNLNKALTDQPEFKGLTVEALMLSLEKLPESIRTVIRNNGGGHFNHSLFWKTMSPQGGSQPQGKLAQDLITSFGGFDKFVEQFSDAALKRFGSGWAWLVIKLKQNKLEITSTPNQDNPMMDGFMPILGLDVWEHAYYLNYQNRRADYIKAWWNVINWDVVEQNYKNSLQQ